MNNVFRSISCSGQNVEFSKEKDLVTWKISQFQGGTITRALFKVITRALLKITTIVLYFLRLW